MAYYIHNDLVRAVAESDNDITEKFCWNNFDIRIKEPCYVDKIVKNPQFRYEHINILKSEDYAYINKYVKHISIESLNLDILLGLIEVVRRFRIKNLNIVIGCDIDDNLIKNLNILAKENCFERLEIKVSVVTIDLSFIEHMTTLRSLLLDSDLWIDTISMKFIKKLVNLERLDMYYRGTLDYLFENNIALKYLNFSYQFNSPIHSLSHLTNLEELMFGDEFDQSLEPLRSLKNLKFLRIGEDFSQSFDPLGDLDNLRYLKIYPQDTKYLHNALLKLKKLKKIVIHGNYEGTIEFLRDLTIECLIFDKCIFSASRGFNKTILPLENCYNLKILIFGDNFNQNITPLKSLKNLERIRFGYYFDQDISALRDITNLTHLTFEGEFDQDISSLQGLTKLKYLEFGYKFNQPIDALKNLTKLKHLKFGVSFNQPINALKNLTKLKHLEFGDDFNQSIDDLEDMIYMKNIVFGRCFNQSVRGLRYMKRLIKLNFGNRFNQDITQLSDLVNLTELNFGSDFNQDISALKNMIRLSILTFECQDITDKEESMFNKPIDALENLTELTELIFSDHFNRSIEPLAKLTKLRLLIFCGEFNQNIDSLKDLVNMEELKFGDKFNKHIDVLEYLVNINNLELGENFSKSIQPLKYLKNLRRLTLLSFRYYVADKAKMNNFESNSHLNSIDVLKNLPCLQCIETSKLLYDWFCRELHNIHVGRYINRTKNTHGSDLLKLNLIE